MFNPIGFDTDDVEVRCDIVITNKATGASTRVLTNPLVLSETVVGDDGNEVQFVSRRSFRRLFGEGLKETVKRLSTVFADASPPEGYNFPERAAKKVAKKKVAKKKAKK